METQNDSEEEFPDLPPNIMLDLGLENDVEENNGLHELPDELRKESYLSNIIEAYASDSSLSSSDNEYEEAVMNTQTDEGIETQRDAPALNDYEVSEKMLKEVIANFCFKKWKGYVSYYIDHDPTDRMLIGLY